MHCQCAYKLPDFCVSGLPGLTLMLADMGVAKIDLHGPRQLHGYQKSVHTILGKQRITVNLPSNTSAGDSRILEQLPTYQDENLTVRTLELEPDQQEPEEGVRDKGGVPAAKKPRWVPGIQNSVAVFICKLADAPGKFNPQRAMELGLRPGRRYKQLQDGESVKAPDGRIVQPSDVIGPPRLGPSFLIIDCPSLSFVPPITSHCLLQREVFEAHGESVALIVHMAPPTVLDSPSYVSWMASFGPDTHHLLLGGALCPQEVTLRGIMKVQCPLHLMNPSVHHALQPGYRLVDAVPLAGLRVSRELALDLLVVGQSLMKFQLKPVTKMGVDHSTCLESFRDKLDMQLADIQSNENVMKAISRCRRMDRADCITSAPTELLSPLVDTHPPPQLLLPPNDALVTFLGTGSAIPTKYRNVSGTLLQTPDHGNVLLDGGEGTLAQIYRCFGRERGDNILRDLRTVFVSHVHADHHLGLIGVLKRRTELLKAGGREGESTVVVAPVFVSNWLKSYCQECEAMNFDLVDSRWLVTKRDSASDQQTSPLRMPASPSSSTSSTLPPQSTIMNGLALQTVPVNHVRESYGIILRHPSGWSLVFSGDTRPCAELARAGRNADLLIHEATFEDDLQAEAQARKHSTLSEALGIAAKMEAKFTLLTHFSQRYPKVSLALLQEKERCSNVALAFDLMSVRLSDLQTLPSFLPAILDIFTELQDPDDLCTAEATVSAW